MKAGWKLRRVVEEFEVPFEVGGKTSMLRRQRLECGHVVRPRHLSSNAEKITAVFRLVEGTTEKRRCWTCGKPSDPNYCRCGGPWSIKGTCLMCGQAKSSPTP